GRVAARRPNTATGTADGIETTAAKIKRGTGGESPDAETLADNATAAEAAGGAETVPETAALAQAPNPNGTDASPTALASGTTRPGRQAPRTDNEASAALAESSDGPTGEIDPGESPVTNGRVAA